MGFHVSTVQTRNRRVASASGTAHVQGVRGGVHQGSIPNPLLTTIVLPCFIAGVPHSLHGR